MNKHTIKGLLIGAVLTSAVHLTGAAEASTNAIKGYFHDKGWWSASAEWAKDNGLMSGQGDGSFGGDKPVTRGELAQVLKNLDAKGKFADSVAPKEQPQNTAGPKDPNPAIVVSQFPELVTMDNASKIVIGMTEKEVYSIFGSSGSTSNFEQGGIVHVIWKNAEYKICHVYFLGGLVTKVVNALDATF
jgi:hypothetical protein